MGTELTLIGHSQRTSPLLLLYWLELVIFIHAHIEGFPEADPLSVLDRLINPMRVLLICILQWQVFLFKDVFSPSEITIDARLLEFIEFAYVALVDHF